MSSPIDTDRGIRDIDAEVAALLRSCDVWDMTLPWTPRYWDIETLVRYKRAGFTFVSATLQDWPPTLDGMRDCIERFKTLAAPQSDWLTFGSSLDDIVRGRAEGKLVIGLNSQETCLIGNDLSQIAALYGLGVRHMLLAYNVRNHVAGGCAEPDEAGLSSFGRQVVAEMNRIGIIVDCSHTGRRSSLEAIEISERPAIFSHSNAYRVCAHIRNIDDEQIRACASRGGVIGVVGIGSFLGDPEARTESLFRHIDYIAALVGPHHVGLGTDYVNDMRSLWETLRRQKETAWPDPTGTQLYEGSCFQPEQITELIATMLAHGYPSEAVKGILGANFMRVYEAA